MPGPSFAPVARRGRRVLPGVRARRRRASGSLVGAIDPRPHAPVLGPRGPARLRRGMPPATAASAVIVGRCCPPPAGTPPARRPHPAAVVPAAARRDRDDASSWPASSLGGWALILGLHRARRHGASAGCWDAAQGVRRDRAGRHHRATSTPAATRRGPRRRSRRSRCIVVLGARAVLEPPAELRPAWRPRRAAGRAAARSPGSGAAAAERPPPIEPTPWSPPSTLSGSRRRHGARRRAVHARVRQPGPAAPRRAAQGRGRRRRVQGRDRHRPRRYDLRCPGHPRRRATRSSARSTRT